MKRIPKLILLGLALLAAGGAAAYSMLAPTAVPLTQILPKTAELSFTEQGLFTSGDVVYIYPLAQGRLLETPAEEGASVRAGDVLCVIDAEPLRLKIDQLQANIKGYEAQVRALEAQEKSGNEAVEEQLRLQSILLEQSQRNLDRAREELARAEFLYQEGSLAQVEVDTARAAVEQYESALAAGRQELAVIAAGASSGGMADYYRALIDVDRAGIAQLEREIASCTVTATAGGVLSKLHIKDVNYVSGASPIAEITVGEGGAIETFVSTRDVGSIRVGDTVELIRKQREGDVVFPGTVTHIDADAEVRLSALGLEERRVKVEIMPGPPAEGGAAPGAGYDVDVKFILYREENKLTVPKTALFQDGGGDMLWVVRDGRAQAIAVTAGLELRTETIIEAGLSPGDTVVTDANNKLLKNGLKVIAG